MINETRRVMGQLPDAVTETIRAQVACGELSGPEGQRLIAEHWGVDLTRVQEPESRDAGVTLFDAAAAQAFDDYSTHTIAPGELKQCLRGHQFFVPFPRTIGA